MPAFQLRVENLRALRQVSWDLGTTNVLIGPNGAGKTTLLLVLKLLRAAIDRDLPEAVTTVLGGSGELRTWGEPEEAPIRIRVELGDLSWQVDLLPDGATVSDRAPESLSKGDAVIFRKNASGDLDYGGERSASLDRLALRVLLDRGTDNADIERMAGFLRSLTVFHDPDHHDIRTSGSRTTQLAHLHSRGLNVVTMLRKWHQERALRPRFQFVLDGLKAAFPDLISDIDFREAGQTLAAQVYRPGVEAPSPLAVQANGLVAAMVLFADVAAAPDGGVVAIDEPETSLHPWAIRRFLELASEWARQHELSLVLATHSPVLLDLLSPERVFVMTGTQGVQPMRLDRLKNPEWLAQFRIGELYARDELGGNADRS